MEQSFLKQMSGFLRDKKNRKRYIAVFLCLALVVSLTTFVSLTMSGNAQNHMVKVLDCKYEAHKHTADCYDKEHPDQLICGYADYAVHIHNDDCYDASGVLVCQLPQIEPHTHDETCYTEEKTLTCELPESEGHVHTEACYTTEQGELTCTVEEHTHSEECYDENGEVICGKEEHTHNEACYEQIQTLTCEIPEGEGAHTHTDDCYVTEKKLTCGKLELHTHTEECYQHDENGKLVLANDAELVLDDEGNPVFDEEHQPIVICGIPVLEEHVHGADCFKTVELTDEEVDGFDTPETSQAPAESESCYDAEGNLTCTKEEHTHTEECYDEAAAEIVCGKEEHTHTAPAPAEAESCYDAEGNLTCTKEEHTHSEECYGEDGALICEKEEHTHTAPVPAEAESCYDAEGNLICTKEEHTHTEECYGEDGALICEKEEHTHTGAGESNEPEELTKTYQDSGVVITATYTEAANIPEEAELIAKAVTSETDPELYAQRMEEALQHVTLPEDAETPNMLLYNIGFYVNGEEVEPAAPVTITVQLLNAEGFAVGAPITVVHFADDGTEVLDGTALNANSETTFTTDGFSPFALMSGADFGFIPAANEEPTPIAETSSDDPRDLSNYIPEKGVTYKDNTATYDPLTEEWFARFRMNFTIPKNVLESYKEFDYVFPSDVYVPDSMLSTTKEPKIYKDKDGRFEFWFEKGADDQYHLKVKFYDDAVSKMGDDVKCYVEFNAKGGKETYKDGIDVPFTDKADVKVEQKDVSTHYDLSVNKYGNVSLRDGKLYYTVEVNSKYGTEGDITLTDKPDFGGLDVKGPNNVTVQEQELKGYTYENVGGPQNKTVEPDVSGKWELTLDKLKPAGGNSHRYLVTYEYDLPEDFDYSENPQVKNSVEVESKGKGGHDDFSMTVEKKVVEKSGNVYTDSEGKQYVEWHVRVNASQLDIAGAKLTDEWLKKADYFRIWPTNGVEVHKNTGNSEIEVDQATGEVRFKNNERIDHLEFTAVDSGTENHTTYDITYRTPVPDGWDEGEVTDVRNTATLVDPYGKADDEDTSTVKPGGTPGTPSTPEPETTKTLDGYTNTDGGRNYHWTVKIPTVDGTLPANFKFTEIIGNNNTYHYMTYSQLQAFMAALADQGIKLNMLSDVTFTCVNWTAPHSNYTKGQTGYFNPSTGVCDSTKHKIDEDCMIYMFEFSLKEAATGLKTDADGNLVIEYETFVPTPKDGDEVYEKGLQVTNSFNGVDRSETEYYDDLEKYHDNESGEDYVKVDKEKGTISWKVRILVGEDHDQLIITDTPTTPGLTLESLTYTVYLHAGTEDTKHKSGYIEIQGDKLLLDGEEIGKYDSTTGKTEFTIKDKEWLKRKDQWHVKLIELTYTYQLPENDWKALIDPNNASHPEIRTYNNTVSVDFDGKIMEDGDSITVKGLEDEDFSDEYLKKTGTWDKNNHIFEFSVDINPNKKTLNDGELVELVDTLTYTVEKELDPSIQFKNEYEYEWGTKILYDQVYQLNTGSVALYEAKLDEETKQWVADYEKEIPESDWSWEPATTIGEDGQVNAIIRAKVPDEKHLILVYEYSVTVTNWRIKHADGTVEKTELSTLQESPNAFVETWGVTHLPKVEATNSAKLRGTYHQEIPVEQDWEESEAEGGSSTQGYSIVKFSSKDASTLLAGAEFTLYKMGDDGNPNEVKDAKFTTGSDGRITLEVETENDGDRYKYKLIVHDAKFDEEGKTFEFDLEPDTLYYLVETRAPTDYTKPENPPKSWFWYGEDKDDVTKLTGYEKIGEDNVIINLAKDRYYANYVPNEPSPNPGYTLPETGGDTTHMYMLGGAMLLLLAAALAYKAKISGRRFFRG